MIGLWISFSLKIHHGRLKMFIEHRRARTILETTSVSFIIRIGFQNIIHINFIFVKSKNIIYCVHIDVDSGMLTIDDVSC